MVFESLYDKENYFHLSGKAQRTVGSKNHGKVRSSSHGLAPRTQGLIDSLKDLSLAGTTTERKKHDSSSPRSKKTRWSSPVKSSPNIIKNNDLPSDSKSLDSCLFEIFHSKDVDRRPSASPPSRKQRCTSPPEKRVVNRSALLQEKKTKTNNEKKRRGKQKDIRYYFQKNAKVKVISYSNEIFPMEVVKLSPKKSVDSNDNMEFESTVVDIKKEESDMEIENTSFEKSELKSRGDKISPVKHCKASSDVSKSAAKSKFKREKSFESPKSDEKPPREIIKKNPYRERSPLVPSNQSRKTDVSGIDVKPLNFTSKLAHCNSRRLLKPVSSRFRRYSSMFEISTRYSTPSFRKQNPKRAAVTEPRNKRKISPRELFDDLDKSEQRAAKKARKCVEMPDILLPPTVQRIPLFKPSNELRCYGDVDLGVHPLPTTKECESCNTSKTPLWRDTDDGIPLCNACGIRWRKHKYRCIHCWYVPMPEEEAHPYCGSCGKYNSFKRFKILRRHMTSIV